MGSIRCPVRVYSFKPASKSPSLFIYRHQVLLDNLRLTESNGNLTGFGVTTGGLSLFL